MSTPNDKFTTPAEVVALRASEPSPENALERAERVLRERRGECIELGYFPDLDDFGEPRRFDTSGERIPEQ